ncbi:probable transcription factor At1g61730 [Olea europaea var. sylvestris]|uniref:probable transcription factor At1g61730 n=1 Tax=Olea europaea var. sylvestris TaxID=158386 RepID=UPI000C1D0FDC|nr:probable transcription factor At1g61730 [Olea europaea var. sylvestris]
MALASKKLVFHSSSSSSASEGSQKINIMDEDVAISEEQKHLEEALVKTQEQEDDSTCVPISKAQEIALFDENQTTTEAGEKEGHEPALDKLTALRIHNQADQQKQSRAVLEKTQEQGDYICDPNSKIKEALAGENQTTEAGQKEGEQASSSDFDFQNLQKNEVITVVESLNPTENPLETDIQETNRKKPLVSFSQIFTDKDVIVLLQGMIDFKCMHGDKNMTDFYFFIKDKLDTEFTKIQITEKLRRLRKKFVGNFKKTTENRAPGDFSNRHDSIVFELSNKLWGNDGCDKKPIIEISEKTRKRRRVEFGSKKEDKKKKGTVEDEVDINMELKYPLIHPSFNQNIGFIAPDMVKKNCTLKGSSNSGNIEAKWEKLMIKEVELYYKKLDLMKEMIGDVLQSLKD